MVSINKKVSEYIWYSNQQLEVSAYMGSDEKKVLFLHVPRHTGITQ